MNRDLCTNFNIYEDQYPKFGRKKIIGLNCDSHFIRLRRNFNFLISKRIISYI